jgi:hypothetical protein
LIDAKLAAALVKARASITNPERDKVGMFASHKYAALENVLDAVQPHLQASGVILMQDIQSARGGVRAVNMFIHETGAMLRTKGPLIMLTDKKPGTTGAAATYAKRYALLAALGIEADADQDVKPMQGKTPAQPKPTEAPGVDESGMSKEQVKKKYYRQINAINAAAKAQDEMEFVKQVTHIPMDDRVVVWDVLASYARTYSKADGVRESIGEADAILNSDVFQEEAIL